MTDTTESLRAVLESCLDKSDPLDVWCQICKRWEGSNEQHSDWCPVPALATALARLEAAERGGIALVDVLAERVQQDEKWGEQNHPDEWYYAILMEEAGELAKAMLESHFEYPGAVYEDIRKEAVETCAVALAMIECIDRRSAR